MTFDDFDKLAASRGLQAQGYDGGKHWKLAGGVRVVNYWPSNGSIYVDGQRHKTRGSPERAIEMACTTAGRKKTKSRSHAKRVSGVTTDDHLAEIAKLRVELRSANKFALMWRHAYHGALDELDELKMEIVRNDHPAAVAGRGNPGERSGPAGA